MSGPVDPETIEPRVTVTRHWAVQVWEVSMICGGVVFAVYHATHIYDYCLVHPWLVVVEFVAGWLLADFVSGVLHWFGDTWGSPRWPVVGPVLIAPFRHHHHAPTAIVEHKLLQTNGNNFFIGVVLMAIALALPEAACVTLVFGSWWGCALNQIHKWAHAPVRSPVVDWLQRSGVILSPVAHARHHRGNFEQSYCIASGRLNPLLDRIGFFSRAERIITAVTGVKPRTQQPS